MCSLCMPSCKISDVTKEGIVMTWSGRGGLCGKILNTGSRVSGHEKFVHGGDRK